MTEPRMIVLMALGGLLWVAGGTWWKGYRRFLWPLAAFFSLVGLVLWWQAAAVGLSLWAAISLPYGDRTPWILRPLVFFALGLPVFWLDHRFGLWWAGGTSLILTVLFILSRKFQSFTWKIWEYIAGTTEAIGIVIAVLRKKKKEDMK